VRKFYDSGDARKIDTNRLRPRRRSVRWRGTARERRRACAKKNGPQSDSRQIAARPSANPPESSFRTR